MTILVTGATGITGSQLIERLIPAAAPDIRYLTRTPDRSRFAGNVEAVKGDLSDVVSFAAALDGVTTLFLLVPNVADEFTQTMNALSLAQRAGVRGIVYLSVYRCDEYIDVPHVTCKAAIERMIQAAGLSATILRAAYFMQNDLRQKASLFGPGYYAMPVGDKGVPMVDTRDIAAVAAKEILRRENSHAPLPSITLNVVGPDNLTGNDVANLWSEALGKTISYGGNDFTAFEDHVREFVPSWFAYDLSLMLRHYQSPGTAADPEDVERITKILGRRPRSYRDFAIQAARSWSAAEASR